MEEELAQFREQWKAEVWQRTHPEEATAPAPTTSTATETAESRPTAPNRSLTNALELYQQAVQHEQQGQLDEALHLYRRSFRIDPHVDRAFHRAQLHIMQTTHSNLPKGSKGKDREGHLRKDSISHDNSTDIRTIVDGFPSQLQFLPENERAPVPIETIPDELVVLILRTFARARDPTSIERFASVNRKARRITLDSTLWRELAGLTYIPPQISEDETLADVVESYNFNYRRTYVEHPRIRLDGVYISVCHYIRPGQSENAWVNINHLITYHRYLRFLPNGRVLSLLANDEHKPAEIVSRLHPSLRMKGLSVGNWRLDATNATVEVTDLVDHSLMGYAFQMILRLKSRPLGRWNKLELIEYTSVNLDTDEELPLPLKHERPFWFSKVRSY